MRSTMHTEDWNNYYITEVSKNKNLVTRLRIILIAILFVIPYQMNEYLFSNPVRTSAISTKIKQVQVKFEVLATKYNVVESQCDSDPLTTADMSHIDIDKLNSGKIRWIAISRDLLNHFSYGDLVLIESDNPNLRGEWEIHDCMNKRFTNRIDFLAPVNDNWNFNKPIKVTLSKIN